MFGQRNTGTDQNNHITDNSSDLTASGSVMQPQIITANDNQVQDNAQSTVQNLNEIPSVPLIETNPIITDSAMGTSADTSPNIPTDSDVSVDLLELKQKALQELTPLVGHLEQTPEEKFRTTMMMIQAADDKSLLSQAYESAQAIIDEKAKAQALLDVVNEINYFTQN
jgi:hypothetical protein